MCSGKVNISCSTSDTSHTLVTNIYLFFLAIYSIDKSYVITSLWYLQTFLLIWFSLLYIETI